MNYTKFKEKAISRLSKFNKNQCGFYNGTLYNYIIPIDKNLTGSLKIEAQCNAIKERGLISMVKDLPFFYDKNSGLNLKLHTYAHHLNSSQMMCYNFFRPLINKTNEASYLLIEILKEFCPRIEYKQQAKAVFEYIEKDNKEKTNFDFYVKSGDVEVFCEIKYTEQNFGKECKAQNDSHFDNQYRSMVDACSNIWKKPVKESDFMSKYFQLFRNALRAKTPNRYVLFICPKERDDLRMSFELFKNDYIKDDCTNIKYVTWEELMFAAEKYGLDVKEFNERYFG